MIFYIEGAVIVSERYQMRQLSYEEKRELKICEIYADIIYDEFSTVYSKILRIMSIEERNERKHLIVFLANYYKVLLQIVSKKTEIDIEILSFLFSLRLEKNGSLYKNASQELKESNLEDFTQLINERCDWVGQSCYNFFSDQEIVTYRNFPSRRIILFLLDCIFFLKTTGNIYSLSELKPLIIVGFSNMLSFTAILPLLVDILIKSQESLTKKLSDPKSIISYVTNINDSKITPMEFNTHIKPITSTVDDGKDDTLRIVLAILGGAAIIVSAILYLIWGI